MSAYATLEQLLDSHTRAKILKLIYRNSDKNYLFTDIVDKSQTKPKDVKMELIRLENMKLIKRLKLNTRVCYTVDKESDYFETIDNLVSGMGTIPLEELKKLIKNLGNIKLALVAGIFMNLNFSKADLLLVGEDISKVKLNNFLKRVEAETGKEIDFALMDTQEYLYRREMFDRFLLDLIDKPHQLLIDKISAGKKFSRMNNGSIQN